MDISVRGLVESIKLDGSLPDGMFEDSDYVEFLNKSYASTVTAFILKHREDYFLKFLDFTPVDDSITIPARAIGSKLNDVVLVDDEGTILGNIPRVSRDTQIAGTNAGFYLEGNTLKLHPKGAYSNKIRIYYYERPLPLDLPENIAEVTAYVGTNAVVDVIPTWLTGVSNCTLTEYNQPYDVSTQVITGIDAESLTIGIDADITSGDFICREGYRAIPDLPYECREVLIQSAILRAMISIKDKDGIQLAGQSLQMAKDDASTILTPRVDNEVKRIIPRRGIWS